MRHDHATHRLKKKDGFKYSRTPVTRTMKGNEKQFELQLELARVRVIGAECKIQFAMFNKKHKHYYLLLLIITLLAVVKLWSTGKEFNRQIKKRGENLIPSQISGGK